MTRDAEHTPSPQSVGPSGPKRVLVLKSAVERLILAADMYGVAHLDSDDMDDDAVELQDATEGMKDALAAAPAPSSLAGGEVYELRRVLADVVAQIKGIRFGYVNGGEGYIEDKEVWERAQRLATLSPEAPARDGVEIGEEFDNAAHCVTLAECPPGLFLWNGTLGFKSEYGAMEPDDATNGKHWKVGNRADAYCADSGEYFWGGTSTYDDRAKVLVYPIDAGKIAMVASHGPAALTPRHEAPAEPVSDRYKFDDEIAWLREAARYFSVRDTKGEDRAHWANVYNAENANKLANRLAELLSNPQELEAPAEGAGEAPQAAVNSLTRSVENFDNGYEWGCDPVAVRAILRHLRARSSAPEAREEALGNLLAVIHGDGGHRALEVGVEQAAAEAEKIVAGLFAAPSADKLRIAVEALERIADEAPYRSGYCQSDVDYAPKLSDKEMQAVAQAALKAEGC